MFIIYQLIHLFLLLSLLSIWYAIQQWNKTFKEHRLWITFRELWIHCINKSLCCLNRPFSARFSSIVLTHALHCRSAMAHALQFPLSFGLNKSGFSAAKWDWVFKKMRTWRGESVFQSTSRSISWQQTMEGFSFTGLNMTLKSCLVQSTVNSYVNLLACVRKGRCIWKAKIR